MVFLVPAKMDWPHSLLFLPLKIENLGSNTTNKGRLKDKKKRTDWLGPLGLEELRHCDSLGFLLTCHIFRKGCLRGVQRGIINRYRQKSPKKPVPCS